MLHTSNFLLFAWGVVLSRYYYYGCHLAQPHITNQKPLLDEDQQFGVLLSRRATNIASTGVEELLRTLPLKHTRYVIQIIRSKHHNFHENLLPLIHYTKIYHVASDLYCAQAKMIKHEVALGHDLAGRRQLFCCLRYPLPQQPCACVLR